MKKSVLFPVVAVVVLAGAYVAFDRMNEEAPQVAQGAPEGATALVQVALPAELSPDAQIGERAFNAKCAVCHGVNAAGVDGSGPPLVHKIYEPSHHGDAAFLIAARNGVRSHHWNFGNMMPVEGVTDAEVGFIVEYVRELQRANGIF